MAKTLDKRSLDIAHEKAMKQKPTFEDVPFWVLFADAFGAPGKAGAICLQYLEVAILAYQEAENVRISLKRQQYDEGYP